MKVRTSLGVVWIGLLFLSACSPNAPPSAAPSRTAAASSTPRGISAETLKKFEAEFVPIPGGVLPANFLGKFVVEDSKMANQAVTVGPFWMARHEVTEGEWSEVMPTAPPVGPADEDLPVSNVTWHDATKFIARLNEASGTPIFRLPSAAEWAYACRAGHGGPYEEPKEATLNEHAWWGKNSSGQAHSIARLKPNAWGLRDMLGNVAEWCSDQSERKGSYSLRPIAGGNFENVNLSSFTCGVTGVLADDEGDAYTGFRLARSYRPGEKAPAGPSKKDK
jgi:formylglycine-generating enzyme required for sulfatase activity